MIKFLLIVYIAPIAIFWVLQFMQYFGGDREINGTVTITHEYSGKKLSLSDKVAIFIPVINILTVISYLRDFIKAEE